LSGILTSSNHEKVTGRWAARGPLWYAGTSLCLSLLPTLVGCSEAVPETYAVRGNVTYKGEAVPNGVVMFMPVGAGNRVNGSIQPDGHYELLVAPGAYKVAVLASREAPAREVTKENWVEAFQGVTKPYLPPQFGDPETSPLACTVAASSENRFDIDIK
jgi:hypothetical protein